MWFISIWDVGADSIQAYYLLIQAYYLQIQAEPQIDLIDKGYADVAAVMH